MVVDKQCRDETYIVPALKYNNTAVFSDMAAYIIAVRCEGLAAEERQVLDRKKERMKGERKEGMEERRNKLHPIPSFVFSPHVVLIMISPFFNK